MSAGRCIVLRRPFKSGDRVVYRMVKESSCPGPRATNIEPTRFGETYHYQVEKYWVVSEVRDSGEVEIRTRKGKTRLIEPGDQRLRHANVFEHLFLRKRFPGNGCPDRVSGKVLR